MVSMDWEGIREKRWEKGKVREKEIGVISF